MPEVKIIINENSCRGCHLCINECPIEDVIVFDEKKNIAKPSKYYDCIACLSCTYICPSNAIDHENIHIVPNFYRKTLVTQTLRKFI